MDCAGPGSVRPRGSVACSVGSIGGNRTRSDPCRGDAYATDYDKRTFATGDRIEISKSVTAESALYQRKAEGGWGLAEGQTALTTTGSESFAASFPEEFSSILADQSTPTNFWKSNRLTAAGVSNGNKCSFTFAPAAAKVTVVVTYQLSQTPDNASVRDGDSYRCRYLGNHNPVLRFGKHDGFRPPYLCGDSLSRLAAVHHQAENDDGTGKDLYRRVTVYATGGI